MTLRLLGGLAAGFLVLDRSAAALGSTLGQAGVLVGALSVATMIVAEKLLFSTPLRAPKPLRAALADLGFGRPRRRGVAAAAALGAALLLFFPVFARATGTPIALRDGWVLLVPGLFAQGGIAEECLFRGYLFGHLRRERSFWRAAWLSVPPFVAVHLLLFITMPPPIAAAATLLALAMSFPLARLRDLGGGTIWAPALLHFVAQGAVKVVVVPESAQASLGIAWMAVCAVLPWAIFVVKDGEAPGVHQASSIVPP